LAWLFLPFFLKAAPAPRPKGRKTREGTTLNANQRPIGVLIVGCLYIAVGAVGLVRHFPALHAIHQEDVWILLTELLAIVAGVFMLLRHNWARWLAVAWMALHVALSWPSVRQLAVHTLILAAIAWLLFRADARQFFAADRAEG
jgi:hypothetical protein